MPVAMNGATGSKKRKSAKESAIPSSKRRAVAETQSEDEMARIQELEDQISESRKYYNNIATLISMLNADGKPNLAVAVSLCRVFSRLIAVGNLTETSRAAENEKIIVAWLKERCREYQKALVSILREGDPSSQITALTLCMRIVNERATHLPGDDTQVWLSGLFKSVFEAVIEAKNGQTLRAEFLEKFAKVYEDVRYYTFVQIPDYAATERTPEILDTLISMLSECDTVPGPEHKFENFYSKSSRQNKKLLSVTAHKKRAQDAWLAILRSDLSHPQRKVLLRNMVHNIEPWFNRPELLMDFLTDSYNVGGATSLLALSGLFYLIEEKNLDYPQFYHKLYSLLDADLLHSKHRSRFFRLMNTFLSSTHLPAALIASFIKRLSRLALNAPPTAIVVIVPFIYNLLKNHPTCTYMLHRTVRGDDATAKLEAEGMDDPFNMNEPDPTRTKAIESSLWELETLQSHYHPNVAAIARIISEQFTKQAYSLEDFLDYTYQGMLQAELGTENKPFKRIPVVEYHIPKRIFTDRMLKEDGGQDTAPGNFMRGLWSFE
ncbi:ribosome biosynthesis protein NOC4 [Aspergillus clavatus NRRL 1]|uniref:Ribosome biogenesis protein Noc4, putative n=1 Tax=Aspergillus clavatus (strain ATCC 1007 / CBS 513.65 / DSM 816 / NCTC 3887 / NRRL 1 / QM 1276 / 107) TaxID=344612 RepID=A1C483_ASPCL|nr:ribosome biogenesis protein Noc4, putative [Aspergillus clavatus NRRL 1]EAW15223.1 ribosome biogenesis protein Noc4, putative [Aspergillus clavatus NRRL 1]